MQFEINKEFMDVVAFHEKFGLAVKLREPTFFSDDNLLEYRYKFMLEEIEETNTAAENNDLPAFLDGLVDFVYVAFGTAYLLGLPWQNQPRYKDLHDLFEGFSPTINRKPKILQGIERPLLLTQIVSYVQQFAVYHEERNMVGVSGCLARAVAHTYSIVRKCSLPWEAAWNEVQRANMSKVRAKRADESTRNSTYDVIKPEGWQPPNITAVIEEALNAPMQQ